MQQQIRTQTPKKNKPAASLIISWLIILGVYLLLRLVFVIFGFHLAPVVLGGCLAVLPYIAGAFYLFKTPAAHRVGGCVLGILLPSIVEKLVLYFLGASLYGIPLADVSGVMSRIAANEPFTHIFSNPAARYILNLSFFGWQYIVGSIVVCAILILEAKNPLIILVDKPAQSLKASSCMLPLTSSGNVLFAEGEKLQESFDESKLIDYGSIEEFQMNH